MTSYNSNWFTLLLLCTSAPLVLCCERFDRGSRQVKRGPVDLVTEDYDVSHFQRIGPSQNGYCPFLKKCSVFENWLLYRISWFTCHIFFKIMLFSFVFVFIYLSRYYFVYHRTITLTLILTLILVLTPILILILTLTPYTLCYPCNTGQRWSR